MIFICFFNFNFNKKNNRKSIEHVVNFLKLVLRVLKTVLRNQKNLIFKNRLKHLKRKCFSVLRQKQSCSHGVKNGCKNLQRFSFKPLKLFCLWSKQGLRDKVFIPEPSWKIKCKKIIWKKTNFHIKGIIVYLREWFFKESWKKFSYSIKAFRIS